MSNATNDVGGETVKGRGVVRLEVVGPMVEAVATAIQALRAAGVRVEVRVVTDRPEGETLTAPAAPPLVPPGAGLPVPPDLNGSQVFRSIVEHSSNLFYVHGPDHVLTYLSPRCREILGCEPEEALRPWTELVTDNPINAEGFAATLRALESGVAQPPYQLELRRKDGTHCWVEVHEMPVVRDGRTVAIIGALHDVTERRRSEEREQRRIRYLAGINRVMTHITNLMPTEELLTVAAREVREGLGYHNVVVLLLDAARGELGRQSLEGAYAHLAPSDYRQRVGEGLIGLAARDGVTVVSNDVRSDPRYIVGFPVPVATRAEIAVPLKIGDQVLGVLDVQEPHPDAFDDLDVQALETLAGQLAASIAAARLLARLQRELGERERVEEALREVMAALERGRAELERRVEERTAELAAANRKLAAEIQERRAAEESVRASEERFRALAEHSVDVIMRFDRQGRHLYVNAPVEAQTGMPPAHFLGKTHRELGFPEELCELWEQALARVFATGAPHRVEFQLPAGIWIDWMLMPEKGPNGEVTAVITDARDITERKEMEAELERRVAERTAELASAYQALQRSEERYRRFFEEDLTGDFISTPQGRLLAANSAFLQIFGFSSMEEALTTNVAELYRSREEREAFLEELRREGRITQREVERRRRDGTPVFLVENVSASFSPTGELETLWGYLFDITARKRLEEQLREAQKMEAIGRLAGGVAHDFNNLLQGILSLGQVLAAKTRDSELQAAAAELVAHVRRGAELTRQLLLFSRREVARRVVLDLNEVVGEGMRLLRRVIPETLQVAVDLAPEALPVEGDRGQLQQVLTNLVLNARDAMPGGGALTVTTGRAEGWVWLEVRDTGVGMDEATRERIFEPFFTTKGREMGIGLGLAVVHGIVEYHGGHIEVASACGLGSRFRVLLPVAPVAGAGAGPRTETLELPHGEGERVLVVEDEDGAREGLRQLLELLGYQVTAVASGEQALALAAGPSFHVLLTDYLLPGIDGVSLSRELGSRWPGLKVILMSGYAEDGFVREAVAGGRLRFLAKPFDLASLAREVRATLAGPVVDPRE